MILSHIVAAAKNGVIGTQNSLPWDIPEDMKFFREKTKGHIMIMGRKTFDSFGGKPLPKRLHIVVSKSQRGTDSESVKYVSDIESAIKLASTHLPQYNDEVFIIGGGEIYKQTLNLVDKIYLTQIDKVFDGDTYYPSVPSRDFNLTAKVDRFDPVPFSFLTFERKK